MTPLLLIGCGNMGSALLARWGDSFSVTVVEPNAPITIPHVKQISALPENFAPAIIVFAVKPQQLAELLPDVAKRFGSTPTYLSIAAGKTIAFFEQHLGQGAGIVRSMPNTPAMIGQGMTALCQNGSVSTDGRKIATELMNAVGDTLWLESETLMDAVTAISGSGPAYIYYIIECMVAAGVKQGLSHAQASQLALKTCAGAASLAAQSPKDVVELRKNVTSQGGTTEAALAILQKNNALQNLIEEAVSAAVKRAKEL